MVKLTDADTHIGGYSRSGLGPGDVGLLSDILNPSLGQDSMRAALWLAPAAAIAYAMATRTLISDIARAEGKPTS